MNSNTSFSLKYKKARKETSEDLCHNKVKLKLLYFKSGLIYGHL